MAEYNTSPAQQARTRGYSDGPVLSSSASPVQSPGRRMSLTRPPRSEQRRSQVYAAEMVLPGDDGATAPVLLPPITTQRLSSLPRDPSESSLHGMKRSSALRDVSLGREEDAPSRDAHGDGSRPHTPWSATRAPDGGQRGSPEGWISERVRTPTGGSVEGRDLTPRQASPHTPRQRESSGGSSSPLHQPPILLSRTSLSSRYSSPTQSNSFRASTPSSDRRSSSGQTKAQANSSDSDYSLDDDSGESQGWTGIDMPASSSPPKSPLLAQTLAEARRHHSFASMTAPLQDDAMEDIDSVGPAPRRGSINSLGLGSGSRNGSVDASMVDEVEIPTRRGSLAEQRRTASNRQSVAEEKGAQVAWWTAGLADNLEDPDPPRNSVDSLSHAEFQANVLGASPDPDVTDTQGVGTAVDWDDSEPARPTTPQPSTYQPRPPSISPGSRPLDLPSPTTSSHSDSLLSTRDRTSSDQSPQRAASAASDSSPDAYSTTHHSHRPPPISIPTRYETESSARPSSRSGLTMSQEEDRTRLSPNRATVDSVEPSPMALQKSSTPSLQVPKAEPEPLGAVDTSSSPLPSLPSSLPSLSTLTENHASASTTKLVATESSASSSPSPRRNRKDLPPPPEKSRKRASTIRRTSRQPGDEPPPSPTPPPEFSEGAAPSISQHSSSSSSDFRLGARQDSATTPITPLSASDFAEAYGGKEFGRSSSIDFSLPSAPSSSHIRSPAVTDSPTVTPAPQMPSPVPPVGADDSRLDRSSRISRSDSLTMMADLNAQLSDAISNVNLGVEKGWSEEAAPTKRAVKAIQQEEDASKRLSEAASEDSFHDAPTIGVTGTAALSLGASPQLPPLPADASPAGSRPTSPSLNKLDAKARAAAFVADLKRARAAAGASASSTPGSSPSLAFASPSLSLTTSPLAGDSPSSHAPETFHTPHQPAESPSDFTVLPPPRSASFVREVPAPHSLPASTYVAPEHFPRMASPPPPPPRSSMDRRTSESRLPDLPRSPAVLSTLPALPSTLSLSSAPAVRLDRLHRRRPLPACLSIAPELKKARTPGDRASIYATKINQLRKESSGVSDWISAVRAPIGTPSYVSPVPGSPGRSRRDASSASFPSRGDGYKAREIPNGSFSPRDLTPSVPFPGVLPPPSSSSTRSFSSSLSKPPSASSNKSFFSGLGRKASKRSFSGAAGGIGAISAPQAGSLSTTSQRPSITSLNISQASSISSASGRPLGPRMPGTSRASMDVDMYSSPSPSSSPNLTQAGLPSRASFSYGSSSGNTPLPLISSSNASGGSSITAASTATAGMVDEDKLERLSNILPLAGREDLVTALEKAGGDEVLAVSIFLSDEATRKQ